MISDVPGPPSAPEVDEIFRKSCVVSWRPPEVDGGTAVTGYYIERSVARANRWIVINRTAIKDTKYMVEDLIQDNEYQFRIIAENKVGQGPPGPSSRPIVAKDPWGKCHIETASENIVVIS